ncbi:hypothetical protein [Mycolicibacterium austroafricanum]|uniref:hypothetical protein n=1 Tax=Mycolicibacterium austroafricanum TaxID=39687 RepID=UPI003AF33488
MPRSESSADEAAQKLAQILPEAAGDALLADAEASGTPIDALMGCCVNNLSGHES